MNNVKIKSYIVVTVLFLSGCASQKIKPNAPDNRVSAIQYRQAAQSQFVKWDIDHNTLIDQKEIPINVKKRLKILDKNKDGKAHYDEFLKEVDFEFYRRDLNHDNFLSPEEINSTGSDFELYN